MADSEITTERALLRIHAGLLSVLQTKNPQCFEQGRRASLGKLIDFVSACEPLPASVLALKEIDQSASDSTLFRASVIKAHGDFGRELRRWDYPSLDEVESSVALLLLGYEDSEYAPPANQDDETESLPEDWQARVTEIRDRLLDQRGKHPFAEWRIPRLVWETELCEAYSLVGDDEVRKALILIPSKESSQIPEAERAWALRAKAAQILCDNRSIHWAAVIGLSEPCRPAYLILEDINLKPLNPDALLMRDCVEVGIAVANILVALNNLGISVLDVRPESIVFDPLSPSRIIQLLDATSVFPLTGLLPEQHTLHRDLLTSSVGGLESSQAFLVGALTLSFLQKTTEKIFKERNFSQGCSARFAQIARMPELSDSPIDRIAQVLSSDLEARISYEGERLDAKRLVHVLRWCLAERKGDRYARLPQVVSDLKGALC